MIAKHFFANALDEFEIQFDRIICAEFYHFSPDENYELICKALLPQEASSEQKIRFWNDLEFEFLWGGGELGATVWLNDGSWLEVNAQNGSDRWIRFSRPPIPRHLLGTKDE